MKPGMRENEAVGLVAKRLYDLGSEYVEGVNAISGERCSPHPHVFSDRMLRPGDPVYYDVLHSYMGYRTCYYRSFAIGSASHAMNDAYKRCRDYLDAAIELVRPGRTTAEIAAVWPKAQEFGFPNEEAAFALQMGHGIGLAIWEKPMISRLVSLDHPHEIKPGMVFALETFWPSTDGWTAARIEEEIVVTATGHEVITRFPAEQLLVCGRPYVTVDGPLPTTRELEPPPNKEVLDMIAASAKAESVGRSSGRLRRECRAWESAEQSKLLDSLRLVPNPLSLSTVSLPTTPMAVSVVMPALEMAQETGKLISWKKKEGDRSRKGDMLLEVETDKAVVEVEAQAEGILGGVTGEGRRRRPRGADDRLAAEAGREGAGSDAPTQTGRTMDKTAPAAAASARRRLLTCAPAGPARISPKARRLAKELGVDVSRLRGSGPGGEIVAEDVRRRRKAERRRGAAGGRAAAGRCRRPARQPERSNRSARSAA